MLIRVSKWLRCFRTYPGILGELGCFRTCPGILGDKCDSAEEVALELECICRREPGLWADVSMPQLPY